LAGSHGAWLKYKRNRSQEFVIGGYAVEIFANLPKARRYRWNVGLTTLDMENCRWLRPRLVAQIEFAEWTPASFQLCRAAG
jgi:ATP-dependent DNA ligase